MGEEMLKIYVDGELIATISESGPPLPVGDAIYVTTNEYKISVDGSGKLMEIGCEIHNDLYSCEYSGIQGVIITSPKHFDNNVHAVSGNSLYLMSSETPGGPTEEEPEEEPNVSYNITMTKKKLTVKCAGSTMEQDLVIDGSNLKNEVTLQEKTVSPTTSPQSVTPDSGYDGLSKVTVNAMPTSTQATPSITVSSSGLITASATQSAGYVTAGTKRATKQLTTQAAKTITPSTSSQTAVASGRYTTGAVTVAAIPSTYVKPTTIKTATTYTPTTSDQTIAAGTYCSGAQTIKGDNNLVAENIKSGISIFGVSGSYEGSGGGTDSTKTWVAYKDGFYFDPVLDESTNTYPLYIKISDVFKSYIENGESSPMDLDVVTGVSGTSSFLIYVIDGTLMFLDMDALYGATEYECTEVDTNVYKVLYHPANSSSTPHSFMSTYSEGQNAYFVYDDSSGSNIRYLESCSLSLEVNPVFDGPVAPGSPDSINYELHCVELGGLHTDSETCTSNSTVSYYPLKNSILSISHNRGLYVTTSGSITLVNSFSDNSNDKIVRVYYIEDNSTINISMM